MKKAMLTIVFGSLFVCAVHTNFAQVEKPMLGKDLPKLAVPFLKKPSSLLNKPMVVEFWSIGEGEAACKTSNAYLNEVYKKYKEFGLEIIGVATMGMDPGDIETVKNFLKDQPVDYPIALDKGYAYARKFELNAMPYVYLVNKTGKIVWEGAPTDLKDSDVEKVLDIPPSKKVATPPPKVTAP